jgi:hypothetical protein
MGNCMQKVDLKKDHVNNKFKKELIIVDGIQINNNSEVSQSEKLRKEPFVPSEDIEDNYIWLCLSLNNKDFEKKQKVEKYKITVENNSSKLGPCSSHMWMRKKRIDK